MRPARATTLRRWLFGAAALACAILAAQVLPIVQRQAEQAELHGYATGARLSPTIELATKTLGCFRAIAIIALWIRASDLQQDGKFFELNDDFRIISQLEPRFPGVWAYWAWNVAYNCSVKFPASQPEERWRWVSLGIQILRDDGIRYNPNAPMLYRELGWLYDHKIGGDTDDAHIYYKVQVATDMQEALGRPPYLERLKAMAAAPPTESDLLAEPTVRALVKALKDAGVDPFANPLAVPNRGPTLPPAAQTVLKDNADADALARLDAYLRAVYLRDTLKLDVKRMIRLMGFGPIDWRLPDALALYWSSISVEIFGADVFSAANADRMVFHALVTLYRRGHLRFEPATDDEAATWIAAPEFGFLHAIIRLHEDIVQRNAKTEWEEPTLEGFRNFLREAILDLYTHNDIKRANYYLKKLIELGGESPKSLDEYVYQRFNKLLEAMTTEQALNLVRGYLFRSLLRASVGDTDRAVGEENMARFLYNKYKSGRVSPRILDTIPPLRQLWLDALRQALIQGSFRAFQLDELRRLYPTDVKAIEAEIKRREEQAAQKQPPAPEPLAPRPFPPSSP